MAHRRLDSLLPRLGLALLLAALAPGAGRAADSKAGPAITASGQAQIQTLVGLKESATAVQKKIDSRLVLGLLHERRDARLAALTQFRFVQAEADGRVAVNVLLTDNAGAGRVLHAIAAAGGASVHRTPGVPYISARLRLADLETIAAMPEVRRVRQAVPFATDVINVSEGDKTHGADEVRAFFGVTGAGVKVGILSNGVDSLATLQASGDLPAGVTVLPGQAGSGDEGDAMMEIVHDLAPDAQLYFATAGPDEAQFAQNILDLAAAGCQIIVDDVLYLDENPFEDGPVAQAVNTVTANGVLYFASAGNQGNKDYTQSGVWEGDFVDNGTIGAFPLIGTAHDFGDGNQSIYVTQQAGYGILTWAEHYGLTTGVASTDYDLYDMDNGLTTVFDSSTNVQDGAGGDDFAFEYTGTVFAGERLVVTRFHPGTTTSAPMFNLLAYRGRFDPSLARNGATRGHNSAARAFGVAATPAAAASSFPGSPTGPYPNEFGPGNLPEVFTSDGPRRMLLRTDGSELTPGNRTSTGGVVRQKPDITAADGVSCAAPGFAPFFGTSAAAPHAGAIAALLKSALPSLTADQIRQALVATAIDISSPGFDRTTGAGIVMPHAALDYLGVAGPLQPQTMEVDAHTVTGTNSNANGVWEPGEFVEISPSWKNNMASSQALTGAAANLTGPTDAGTFYNLSDATASYGSIAAGATNGCHGATGDCYVAAVTNTRPAAHWDATLDETLSTGLHRLWKLHIGSTFPDVPVANPFYPFVENLIHNGVTGGCGGGGYCPGNSVTRAQMAVFLLKGKHGASYVPPACAGVFGDVDCASSAFAADWIEQLAAEGVTGGCGSGNYCPGNAVTRAQMAIFLLKAEHGSAYTPPACTGVFPDVACSPAPAFAVDWIEQLYHEGITGGCAGGNYCPGNPVLRGQMAVFLVKTFGLALYGL